MATDTPVNLLQPLETRKEHFVYNECPKTQDPVMPFTMVILFLFYNQNFYSNQKFSLLMPINEPLNLGNIMLDTECNA